MIKGLGIDIVETDRIRQVIERHGDQFLNRVYTPRSPSPLAWGPDFPGAPREAH